MSRQFTAVDLSRLPSPDVVEQLDFETILGEWRKRLREIDPDNFGDEFNETDPAFKILLVGAYRELILRQRVNDAARGVMLAHATGADLDNILAREPYNIERQLIDPGDPDAIPPIDPIWESDADFRLRGQLAPEAYSTAGPEGAYIFHARSASADVLDASVSSPLPGQVVVTVLSRAGDGTPSPAVLSAVEAALAGNRNTRPLTDEVIVQAATVVSYTVEAELILYEGPDETVVLETALARLTAYQERMHRLGMDVSLSGIDGALHCEGVMRVNRITPTENLIIAPHQASWCIGNSVTIGGRDA